MSRHDTLMTVRVASEKCGLQVHGHKEYASNNDTTWCLCACGPFQSHVGHASSDQPWFDRGQLRWKHSDVCPH
jgi:hypothetical protein